MLFARWGWLAFPNTQLAVLFLVFPCIHLAPPIRCHDSRNRVSSVGDSAHGPWPGEWPACSVRRASRLPPSPRVPLLSAPPTLPCTTEHRDNGLCSPGASWALKDVKTPPNGRAEFIPLLSQPSAHTVTQARSLRAEGRVLCPGFFPKGYLKLWDQDPAVASEQFPSW